MKTNSIFFKIRIAFALSAVLILSVFALVYFIEAHHQDMELHQRAMQAARMIKHVSEDEANTAVLDARLKELEFAVPSKEFAEHIIANGTQGMRFERMGPIDVTKYEFEGKRYLVIESKERLTVLENTRAKSPLALLLLGALTSVLAVLALFYRSILNNLEPLKELKTRVESFAKDGIVPPCSTKLCDEIESVSSAFDKSAAHLSNISKARSLFLRNIAHELKTPLSKGRFLAEMVEDEKLQDRFHSLFVHFDTLINELLQVEKLTASGIPLDKKEYLLQDCIDEAIEIGFLDAGRIDVVDNGMHIFVDFKLFSLALKNLLTNALKYSSDGRVTIETSDTQIKIINLGLPLKRPIEQLFEPFVKGEEASDGLGLGLYIIRQVLEAHGLALAYEYKDAKHYFLISF